MKRFVASEMWGRAWFRGLTPRLKCFWVYIFTQCDSAGVWEPDFGLASFQIGEAVAESDMGKFGGRVVKLECGKWFLPAFISFQYGHLTEECRAHRPAIQSVVKYNLAPIMERVSKEYPNSNDTLDDSVKDKDKVKDIDKDKDQEGDARGGGSFKTWTREQLLESVRLNNSEAILIGNEIEDFTDYWMEPAPSGRTRLAMEKTWETKRRMKTAVRLIYERQRSGSGFQKHATTHGPRAIITTAKPEDY